MPRFRRMRLRLARAGAKLKPVRRSARRLRAGAVRELRLLGVVRMRNLLLLPVLLACIALAAYFRLPKAVTAQFQPLEESLVSPLSGFAADARVDPAAVPENVSLVWATATWRELEPEEGAYAFAAFEEAIHWEAWRERGCRLILRLVLDSPSSGVSPDIPQWLYEKTGDGSLYALPEGQGYAPDYSNPALLAAHMRLLQAIAGRYAEEGGLAFVEMGSLGRDGLWETLAGDEAPILPMADVAADYIWQYGSAFPETAVLSPRPYREAMLLEAGAYNAHLGDGQATWDWVNLFAFGGWDETIGVNLRPSEQFGIAAPAGAWLDAGLDPAEALLADTDAFRRMLQESRATYVCLPGAQVWQEAGCLAALEELSREVGYRYWVRQASWPESVRTDYSLYVDLTVRNDGPVPMAYDWPVKLALFRNGELVCSEEIYDARCSQWTQGDTAIRGRITVPAGAEAGTYVLAVAICDPYTGEPAVPMPMECGREGLWALLGEVTVG